MSDVAGFFKETSYWLRSWWLSNISNTDFGKPPLVWTPDVPHPSTTVFIIEGWQPAPAVYHTPNRTINVYTNAPAVRLELNGRPITDEQQVAYFGQATFTVRFEPGNLTAVAVDSRGTVLVSHSVFSPVGSAAKIVLSLDAPSVATGTGTHLVADGEDVAMVRATLLDEAGNFAFNASDNVTFRVLSGPGKIWCTHNGDPASDSPRDAPYHLAYHGLARAFIRSAIDASTPLWHRRRMLEIDVESGRDGSTLIDMRSSASAEDIVIEASVVGNPGIAPAQLTIPVSVDLAHLPRAIASQFV